MRRSRAVNPHGHEVGRRRCPGCRAWRYPDAWTWQAKECDECVRREARRLREEWGRRMRGETGGYRKSPADVGRDPKRAARPKVRRNHLPRFLRGPKQAT